MSVSATFNKSKTNQLINFILEKYGKEDEYDIIIQHALQEEWIKTAKPRNTTGDATTTARKSAEKGQSKWTAYQRWAKKWSAWNDTPIDRDTMKEIYAGYDEDELKEWARVADELNAGKDIRDIENKPEIRMPKPKQQDEASSQETVQDEFEAADLNKDGVLDKNEFEAHQAKKQEEELSDVEKLKAQLAAAEAKIAEK
tara:strand:+ start:933 stop:1529 length:597 start_codon:yes stop_codon:yes gene_type:complete